MSSVLFTNKEYNHALGKSPNSIISLLSYELELFREPCQNKVVLLNPTGVREFSLSPCGPIFFSRAIAPKVLFVIFIQNFNLPHLNLYILFS